MSSRTSIWFCVAGNASMRYFPEFARELFDYFLCSEDGDDAGSAEQIDGMSTEWLQRLQHGTAVEFQL
ncbi:hypothetical protein GRJ2_000663700 [Grus japonensis]|uniref:Uncharacterized protein n=1 Tax=Grus japonensis TaxID=30415 RepID=A0ABC9W8X3_GRUJA